MQHSRHQIALLLNLYLWNNNSHKKTIKGLLVNTKNANTFTGKQGKESIDTLAKNLSRF